jgi:predicted phage tail protein
METGGVSFSVGLDGEIPQPGSIIKIADQNRAGRQIGGRISKSGDDYIVTDRDHPAKVGDKLNVNTVNGSIDSKTIVGIDGRKITVSPNFESKPSTQLVWSIDADDLVTLQARVISVSDSDGITYDISTVIHDHRKFEAIDTGVRLDPLPVSVVPPRTQTAPTNIKIEQFNSFKQGVTRQGAEISWDAPEYAVQYDVQWKRDNGDWVSVPRTGTRTVTLPDIYSGEYLVRVKAINSLNVPSLWGYSDATQLDGIIDPPPVLSFLNTKSEVMSIKLEWGYPSTANIISQVEIRASKTNDFASSYPLTYVAYPSTSFTVNGLGYGTEMFFWARLLDKNGLAGEWKPLDTQAGVYGKSSESSREILDYLQGQISESELAQDLVNEIGKIDGIELDISGIETQITNETQLREFADSALASDISTVAATASSNTAAIQAEQTARANADSALSSDISTVAATAAGNTSAIQSEAQARADADSALSTQINSVLAKANSNTASIQNETTARTDADSALASDISTLQATVNGNTASIQQTSQAVSNLDGDLKANWQVKTEVRSDGKVVQAGVGLGASIGEDGTSRSEFLVHADTVGFLNSTNGVIHAPFIFDTVNDTAILNSAIIGEATIDFAKISDTLQSTNWNWNGGDFTGWKIEKGGNAYFGGDVTFKGTLDGADGNFDGTVYAQKLVGDVVGIGRYGFFAGTAPYKDPLGNESQYYDNVSTGAVLKLITLAFSGEHFDRVVNLNLNIRVSRANDVQDPSNLFQKLRTRIYVGQDTSGTIHQETSIYDYDSGGRGVKGPISAPHLGIMNLPALPTASPRGTLQYYTIAVQMYDLTRTPDVYLTIGSVDSDGNNIATYQIYKESDAIISIP